MRTLRKPGKKDLLEFIEVFRQINSTVAQTKNINVVELTEAQTSAIDVGNYIELAYGEEKTKGIVSDLEEYCENLYKLSLAEDDKIIASIARRISMLLNRVEYEIKNSLPQDKKLVVFLPYKASMWDSLESLYLEEAAKEDTEAYVVPIPYFDRNPDMSLGAMHYEGREYPKDIPVMDWQQIDLVAEHPDTIYIHNPYDEYNRVTSIHPDFYSRRIREYTDCLIYTPYFIADDNTATRENQQNFIRNVAIWLADYVVVQSERLREIYIDELIAWGEENGARADRKSLQKKVVARRPSKLATLERRAKSGDISLPLEWQKFIYHPDGSRKKVIMMNTGLSAVLKHREKTLDKLEDSLKVFYENRERLTLWWRPHPLFVTTLESMLPHLTERYKKIVADYQAGSWGIYDDTSDLDRAVIYSDAYYGDPSSVTRLFGAMRKQIVIANNDVLNGRSDIGKKLFMAVSVMRLANNGKSVYGITQYGGRLFEINVDEIKLCTHCRQNVDKFGVDDYFDVQEVGEELVFVPRNGKYFLAYNRERDRWSSWDKRAVCWSEIGTSTFYSIVYKNVLYCVNRDQPLVVMYSGAEKNWERLEIPVPRNWSLSQCGSNKGKLYMFDRLADVIYCFDVETMNITTIKLTNDFDGNCMLYPFREMLLILNGNTGKLGYIDGGGKCINRVDTAMGRYGCMPVSWERDNEYVILDGNFKYIGLIDKQSLIYRESQLNMCEANGCLIGVTDEFIYLYGGPSDVTGFPKIYIVDKETISCNEMKVAIENRIRDEFMEDYDLVSKQIKVEKYVHENAMGFMAVLSN